MIIDKQLELSSEQAVTASAASTNVIAKGKGDMGLEESLYLAITVKEAATAAGAATVTFSIQQDDDSAFGSAETVFASEAIGKADLIIGKQLFYKLPLGLDKDYARVYYTVATGPLTAGKFDAQIVNGIQKNVAYEGQL